MDSAAWSCAICKDLFCPLFALLSWQEAKGLFTGVYELQELHQQQAWSAADVCGVGVPWSCAGLSPFYAQVGRAEQALGARVAGTHTLWMCCTLCSWHQTLQLLGLRSGSCAFFWDSCSVSSLMPYFSFDLGYLISPLFLPCVTMAAPADPELHCNTRLRDKAQGNESPDSWDELRSHKLNLISQNPQELDESVTKIPLLSPSSCLFSGPFYPSADFVWCLI